MVCALILWMACEPSPWCRKPDVLCARRPRMISSGTRFGLAMGAASCSSTLRRPRRGLARLLRRGDDLRPSDDQRPRPLRGTTCGIAPGVVFVPEEARDQTRHTILRSLVDLRLVARFLRRSMPVGRLPSSEGGCHSLPAGRRDRQGPRRHGRDAAGVRRIAGMSCRIAPTLSPWLNWIERRPPEPKVGGSNPPGDTGLTANQPARRY